MLRVGWVLLGRFWVGSPPLPQHAEASFKEVKDLQSNKEEEFICQFTELRVVDRHRTAALRRVSKAGSNSLPENLA